MYEELRRLADQMSWAEVPASKVPALDLYHYQTFWGSVIALAGGAFVLLGIIVQLWHAQRERKRQLRAYCKSLYSEANNCIDLVLQTPLIVTEARGRMIDIHLRPPEVYQSFIGRLGELPGDLPDAITILWANLENFRRQIETRNLSMKDIVTKNEEYQRTLEAVELQLIERPTSSYLKVRKANLDETLKFGREYLDTINQQNDDLLLATAERTVQIGAVIIPWLKDAAAKLQSLTHEQAKAKYKYPQLEAAFEQYKKTSENKNSNVPENKRLLFSLSASWREQ